MVVPGCLALGWWQATRALSGNTLSWAYTFEWPIFAAYAVFMWWKLLPEQPAGEHAASGPERPLGTPTPTVEVASAAGLTAPTAVATTPTVGSSPMPLEGSAAGEDAELAEYNRYLGALHASGRRKRW